MIRMSRIIREKIWMNIIEVDKKIKGTEINSSQVVRNPMQKHGSLCISTVTNTSLNVKISKKKF